MEVQEYARTVQPPTLQPAISPSVHLSLTVIYTVLYSCLFLIVYVQLWMILYYRHRRFSYQTVFLFLCLIWAALRTTLFSFYYINCTTANNLNTFLYWLLYCCPVALQFITLCLMVIFFAGVYFRSRTPDVSQKYRVPLYTTVILSIIAFLATSISCSVVLKRYDDASDNVPSYISLVRVAISGSLYLLMGALLCVCIYSMNKVAATSVVLEAKGMTVRQSCAACTLIILLYTSRVLYNFIAISKPLSSVISFGYGWINVSDQADFENLDKGFAYVSFGIVLFAWEFLPTLIVVLFFRVQKPDDDSMSVSRLPSDSFSTRAYFFDNPRRYDSDDDIARSSRSGNDSILEADGPYTINSVESSRSYMSSVQQEDAVYIPQTTRNGRTTPSITRNIATTESFYDGT